MAVAAGAVNGQGAKRKEPEGYGDGTAYWNKRYKADTKPFEWLEGFIELEALIKEAASSKLDASILHVGCGTSLLAEDMYDSGYKDITNIDNSEVCIQQMSERNKTKRPSLKWLEMDATNMGLSESSFDVVIDKSVLDTFACGDNASNVIQNYLSEVHRVLRPKGAFLCVSYGAPNTRMDYFQKKGLSFTVRQVPIPVKVAGGSTHYAYVMRKVVAPSGVVVAGRQ
eukprot:TRINITY_DN14297_c0_g1_i1.p1 TRINITY_DN14297_c0_g1~~TRINITY_DN14297_c0_g1_i1.p1  ORF type:complete len:251 (+),score=51.40 TRINITY_DN14297_c0_g1_i1:78-755(+)